MCLGLEPGVAGWYAQTNPLSYGGNPQIDGQLMKQKIISV